MNIILYVLMLTFVQYILGTGTKFIVSD